MKSICLLLTICLYTLCMQGSQIDTIMVRSNTMHKNIPVVVVKPDSMTTDLPTLYLLHGFSDSSLNGWINKVKGITDYADKYHCLLVMPDGGFSSWYFDSPVDSTYRYETFIATELVEYIDRHYPTADTSAHRAITGNSMGGHGALFLALRHPNIFGAAGSTSGGVNLCHFPNSFDIAKRLGSYTNHTERWKECSIYHLVDTITENYPQLVIDCGTDDMFYQDNCRLHEKLEQLHIPHEFTSRPGNHNWSYWSISLQNQMLFFHRFFELSDNN